MEIYFLGILISVLLQFVDQLIYKKIEEPDLNFVSDPLYTTSVVLVGSVLSLMSWVGVAILIYSIYLQIIILKKEKKYAKS